MQLLVLLTWSVAGISTQMLLLTLKMVEYFKFYYYYYGSTDIFVSLCLRQDTFNTLEMINLSIIVFWSFTIIFGVCEFGERLSTTFEKINDVYGQSSWYLFPRKVKLMLPTLMIVAQKPLRLHVFGDISCGRITFENVSKIWISTQKSNSAEQNCNYGQTEDFCNSGKFVILLEFSSQVFNTAYSWFMVLRRFEIWSSHSLGRINSDWIKVMEFTSFPLISGYIFLKVRYQIFDRLFLTQKWLRHYIAFYHEYNLFLLNGVNMKKHTLSLSARVKF